MDDNETVLYREFITVDVGWPELMVNGETMEKYMAYPVSVKTNSLSFAAPHTRVYRRYNDFLWLYRRLKKIPDAHMGASVPSLPRKQLPFWNFEEAFIQKRKKSLQAFLSSVVRETIFLSSSSLHLFLQTQLSIEEMDDALDNGNVDIAINKNLKCVKVDQDFVDSLGSSTESSYDSDPGNRDMRDQDSSDSDGRDSPVYWRCRESTIRKVASLPNFSPVMKQYESLLTLKSSTEGDTTSDA